MTRLTRLGRTLGATLLVLGLSLLMAPAVLAATAGDIDPQALTFGFFITPPGIITAGSFTAVFVQMIKGLFPTLDAKVSGALQAFFFTSLLYIITAVVLAGNGTLLSPDGFLWVFAAWLTCASSAIGVKAGFTHAVNAGAKSLPLTDAIDEPTTDPVVGEDRPDPRYPS